VRDVAVYSVELWSVMVVCTLCSYRPASVMTKRKRPLGKSTLESRPKLFGGSIEEYVQVRHNMKCKAKSTCECMC